LYGETADEQGAESGKYLYRKGDVLYCKIRPALRKACIPTDDGLCSADMYPITPKDGLHPEFLMYLLLTEDFTNYAVEKSMRVAMPKVNREDVNNYILSFPEMKEQEYILSKIKSAKSEIDILISSEEKQISLVQEYRTSLITEVVTGKIDVRN